MRKVYYSFLILILILICLSGCKNTTTKKDDLAEWTIMLYVDGYDLEEGDGTTDNPEGQVTDNIKEILSVEGQPDDINIIVQTGGASYWAKYDISPNHLSRYHIRDNKLILDELLEKRSMGDKDTYQSFLEWGLTNYPAKKTGVIVVGHGSFTAGYCFDEYEEIINDVVLMDRLENTECQIATLNALKNTNTDKLEFIAYSVCLIQGQDLAYKNKDCYKYMLASQEQLLVDSFNYDVWLKDLFEYKDTLTILKSMVDSFFEEVNPLYIEHNEDNIETLSILDLSYMETYKIAFENMAQYLSDNLDYKAKCFFFDWFDENVYHFSNIYPTNAMFDVYDFLNKVEGTIYSPRQEDIDNLKSILDDMIVYNMKGPEVGEANGLSLYFSLIPDFYYRVFKHNTDFINWNKLIDF